MEWDENEVAAKHWMAKEDVLELIRTNEMQDGVSVIAILYALRFG